MAMDAILATVADGVRAIIGIDIEASRNILISRLIFTLILNPLMAALSNPIRRGSRGWDVFYHRKPCCWQDKWLHHGGDVCVLCVLLAKNLLSGSVLFPPEQT
jgi:hypothetical protein